MDEDSACLWLKITIVGIMYANIEVSPSCWRLPSDLVYMHAVVLCYPSVYSIMEE